MDCFFRLHNKVARAGPETVLEWLFFLFLLPFSIIFYVISLIRSQCYDLHFFTVYKSTVPVISVGNLAAGGTGKTPVVDWLVKEFLRQGRNVAVVSRGYGGHQKGRVGVVSEGNGPLLTAPESGDEPYLLSLRNQSALILVARKRSEGVDYAVSELGAEVVILDDAFQHRAVHRDFNLVLLDAAKPFGNGWPLPAGILRELSFSLSRADAILMTRGTNTDFSHRQIPVFSSQHSLAERAMSLEGEERSLTSLKGLRLCAFAGIANPDSFFSELIRAGLSLTKSIAFADHCNYQPGIQERILAAAQGCDALVTTEKDAVKLNCVTFPVPCYQVPMMIDINNQEELIHTIIKRLEC